MKGLPIYQYYVSRKWAIGSDGIQWVLQKKRNNGRWTNHFFVRSDRTILERCMRDCHVPNEDQQHLLSGLSETFDEWVATQTPLPVEIAYDTP